MRTHIFAGLLLLISFFTAYSQDAAPLSKQGDAAIKELKKQGSYKSLMDAVTAAQRSTESKEPSSHAARPELALIESQLIATYPEPADYFGGAVAVYGDEAVVTAFGRNENANQTAWAPSIFIFQRSGANWILETSFSSQDYRNHGDYFGYSVTMGSNVIAVGSPLADIFHPGNGIYQDQGMVTVYRKENGTWVKRGDIFAPDGLAGDHFGTSVGINFNQLLVGAPLDQVGANGAQGSVYLFDVSTQNPLLTDHLTALDGSFGDHFGESVSFTTFYGEYFLVEPPLDNIGFNPDQGSAYLFYKNNGVWNQYSKLVAPDGAASDNFGQSVAMTYLGLTVGSPGDDVGSNEDQGSVYFFDLTGNLSAHLFDSYGRAYDYFGGSVAMYFKKIAIGAEGNNDSRGKAVLFEQVNGNWTQIRYLFAQGGEQGDSFGHRIAFAYDNILVGAWQDAVNGNASAGAAYIYRAASGNWSAQPTTESGVVAFDSFGATVSLDGNTAVVGVPGADLGEAQDVGLAFVFVRSNGIWTLEAQIIPSDGAGSDQFGYSVSVSGDTAVIGAPNKQLGANPAAGKAYIYTRVGGIWSLQSSIEAIDAAPNDNFASSVNINGDDIFVGAPQNDVGATLDAGAIYWFARSGNSWSQTNEYQDPTPNARAYLGRSVAISGDTAVAGEPEQTLSGQLKAGQILIFERTSGSWSSPTAVTAPTNTADYYFGNAVDIDGDSIIASAFGSSAVPSAYVFVRTGPTSWSQQTTFYAPGGPPNLYFTASVAIKGDEAAVGIPYWNEYQGDVVVGHRTGTTWTAQHLPDPPEPGYFGGPGQSVAVDGNTVISGFPAASLSGSSGAGAAIVSVRDGNGVYTREAFLTRSFAGDGAQFGYSVDIDNGIAAIGAPCQLVSSNQCQGAVYVLEQMNGLWSATAQITAADGVPGSYFGTKVSISGDTIAVGVPSDNSNTGAVYIFAKNGMTWTQQAKIVSSYTTAPGSYFGYGLDLDHDDLVVGAPYASNGFGVVELYRRESGIWSYSSGFLNFYQTYYGYSVSINAGFMVAGSPGDGTTQSGTGYFYGRDVNGNWQQFGPLNTPGQPGATCGKSVSISDSNIIVGCPHDSVNGVIAGSAFRIEHFYSLLSSPIKISSTDPQANEGFGNAVTEKNDIILVGSPYRTVNFNQFQGAAYIFYASGSSYVSPALELTQNDGHQGDYFGFSLGVSGNQVIVGSYGHDASPFGFRKSAKMAAPTTAGQDRGAMFSYENQYVAPPTAAHVAIRGRIIDANGKGVGGVSVEVRDNLGNLVATGRSSPFGYYGVENIEVGNTYLVSVTSKRFVFANNPRLVSLNDELTELDFVADPQ